MPGFCVSVRSGLRFEWLEGFVSQDMTVVQSSDPAPEVCGFSLWDAEGAEQ